MKMTKKHNNSNVRSDLEMKIIDLKKDITDRKENIGKGFFGLDMFEKEKECNFLVKKELAKNFRVKYKDMIYLYKEENKKKNMITTSEEDIPNKNKEKEPIKKMSYKDRILSVFKKKKEEIENPKNNIDKIKNMYLYEYEEIEEKMTERSYGISKNTCGCYRDRTRDTISYCDELSRVIGYPNYRGKLFSSCNESSSYENSYKWLRDYVMIPVLKAFILVDKNSEIGKKIEKIVDMVFDDAGYSRNEIEELKQQATNIEYTEGFKDSFKKDEEVVKLGLGNILIQYVKLEQDGKKEEGLNIYNNKFEEIKEEVLNNNLQKDINYPSTNKKVNQLFFLAKKIGKIKEACEFMMLRKGKPSFASYVSKILLENKLYKEYLDMSPEYSFKANYEVVLEYIKEGKVIQAKKMLEGMEKEFIANVIPRCWDERSRAIEMLQLVECLYELKDYEKIVEIYNKIGETHIKNFSEYGYVSTKKKSVKKYYRKAKRYL